MKIHIVTFVAVYFVCALSTQVLAVEKLSLEQTFQLVSQAHPDLRLMDQKRAGLSGELDKSKLKPPLSMGLSTENVMGSGSFKSINRAESTLSLSSVIERSGKLDARQSIAESKIDSYSIERDAIKLDILAETSRRYISVLHAKYQLKVADADISQRDRTVKAAKFRYSSGASPESTVLSTEAALAKAHLERKKAVARIASSKQYLALLWNGDVNTFEIADVPLIDIPTIGNNDDLKSLLKSSPELAIFVSEARLRKAEHRLSEASSRPDITWEIGIKNFRETNDYGFAGSISLPLGFKSRAAIDSRISKSKLDSLDYEYESRELALTSVLSEQIAIFESSKITAEKISTDILPRLIRAEKAAERAYRGGAISYLEWAQLQTETNIARQAQYESAVDAHYALIEIQRLTGQTFLENEVNANKVEL